MKVARNAVNEYWEVQLPDKVKIHHFAASVKIVKPDWGYVSCVMKL
jgi:hypothetical protein